jgi:thiol-disulfide isomerase/thioredoxin
MVVLFIWETKAFLRTTIKTDLLLDRSVNTDQRIRLNFNITMTDLRCDWAVIDVVSVLKTEQNITAHVTKWNVDADGMRRGYRGRNRNQKDLVLFDEEITESLDELHENGEDAISLDGTTLEIFKREHEYLFVDFYASWCSHCKDLAPTWEALAEVMVDAGSSLQKLASGEKHLDDYSEEDYEVAKRVSMPVVIAKIDCVTHATVCNGQENIRAYPTLRLFVDGEAFQGVSDYKGHRTIKEMIDWLTHMEEQHKSLLEKEGGAGDRIRTLHAAHAGTSFFVVAANQPSTTRAYQLFVFSFLLFSFCSMEISLTRTAWW